MSDEHRIFLSLGSNIDPETHLRQAVEMLKLQGQDLSISSVWETKAIGIPGPNFLNACVGLTTPLAPAKIKERIIRPIESALGRIRTEQKDAPRTIDIDLVLYDGEPVRMEYWGQAFMVVPLAELIPEFEHPTLKMKLAQAAKHLREQDWIQPRAGILSGSLDQTEGRSEAQRSRSA